MKKIAAFLSVLPLLAAYGCSNTEDTSAENTSQEPLFTVVIDDLPETTAAPTGQSSESSDIPAASHPEETETIAETTADTAESTAPETESSALADSAAAQTIPAVQDTADLLGTWEYAGSYRYRFLEGNAVEIQLNYSSTMFFSEERLCYDGRQYTPIVEEENIFVKLEDGSILLHLVSLDREDGYHFDGRYRLEDCQFYQFLTEGLTDRPEYYIDVDDSAFRVVMNAEYYASEDGILELVRNGSTLRLQYIVEESSMTIFDETGAQDILKRVE